MQNEKSEGRFGERGLPARNSRYLAANLSAEMSGKDAGHGGQDARDPADYLPSTVNTCRPR
jgi:hypothetical protein